MGACRRRLICALRAKAEKRVWKRDWAHGKAHESLKGTREVGAATARERRETGRELLRRRGGKRREKRACGSCCCRCRSGPLPQSTRSAVAAYPFVLFGSSCLPQSLPTRVSDVIVLLLFQSSSLPLCYLSVAPLSPLFYSMFKTDALT